MELSSTENGLQLMERRQFRQFSRADEYLYAMKEDLAEWMNNLYPLIDMDADNFMNRLETGEHLVQVGNISAFIYVFESTMGLLFHGCEQNPFVYVKLASFKGDQRPYRSFRGVSSSFFVTLLLVVNICFKLTKRLKSLLVNLMNNYEHIFEEFYSISKPVENSPK